MVILRTEVQASDLDSSDGWSHHIGLKPWMQNWTLKGPESIIFVDECHRIMQIQYLEFYRIAQVNFSVIEPNINFLHSRGLLPPLEETPIADVHVSLSHPALMRHAHPPSPGITPRAPSPGERRRKRKVRPYIKILCYMFPYSSRMCDR